MAQIQAALFTLSGGGDRDIFLAPKSALDWCMNVKPGSHAIPDNVLEDLKPFLAAEQDDEITDEVNITSGSADNDAALHLSCLCVTYESTKQAFNKIKEAGWTMDDDDEYEGYIY